MKSHITTLVLASLVAYSSAVPPLSVQGNKLLVGGQASYLQGSSLFWSNEGWGGEKFYNANVINWLKTDWKANVVRAAMGVEDNGGYLSNPDANKKRVTVVVDAAIKADMYVIIDWHSHSAHQHKSEAIKFFREMATKYGKYNNVIFEIFNEPRNDVSWSQVKDYATAVIREIRAVSKNLIVVGTTNWSQDVDVAANDPIRDVKNIAYALHFYCGSHGQDLRNKATTALRKNIALFVTEWGTVNADGNGAVAKDEADRWIKFLKENRISYVNWSTNDKPEGASLLKPGTTPTGRWSPDSLTESGKYVRNLLRSS